MNGKGPAAWHSAHTAEHIWADVGRAPPLVLQQVPFTHEMLPKAEVGDGYPMRPGSGRQKVNTPQDLYLQVPQLPPLLVQGAEESHSGPFLLPWRPCLPHGGVGSASGVLAQASHPWLPPDELAPGI